jgi:DNA-binding NarL/FixJ family response regulator
MTSGGRSATGDTGLLARADTGLVALSFLGARTEQALAIRDAFAHGRYRPAFIDTPHDVEQPSGATSVVVVVGDEQEDLLAALNCISAATPEARVVVLARFRSDHDILPALYAGASGFCDSSASPAAIVRTVDDVVDNGAAIPRWFVSHLVNRLREGPRRTVQCPGGTVELTEREWEVLQQLRLGHTTAEIATTLYVSAGTIRSHVWALVHKCGVEDREALRHIIDTV